MSDAVLLVPGFFGFGTFGDARGDHIAYFDRVTARLAKATGWDASQFDYHEPPPTGPLSERVASLYAEANTLLLQGAQRIHLVGHSTGGVDVRLLTNLRYAWPGQPSDAERRRLIDRIGAVVTVSAPFHGTPAAARLRGGMELSIPALYLLSIVASRAATTRIFGVELAKQLASAVLRRGEWLPAVRTIQQLVSLDGDAAREVHRFLERILADRRLVGDLVPAAMARLNAAIAGGDQRPLTSFVTVSPKPTFGPLGMLSLAMAPIRRSIYAFAYGLTADEVPDLPAARGPWLGQARPELLGDAKASDGVVPARSQTLDGEAAGIICADHLDVIGHFASEGGGITFFKSGAGFDDEEFDVLWESVAGALVEHAATRSGSHSQVH